MKKTFFLYFFWGFIYCTCFTFSQIDPIDTDLNNSKKSAGKHSLAKINQNWDLLFHYNIEDYFGSGSAGAVYLPDLNEIWVSKWSSNDFSIWTFTNDSLTFNFEATIEGVHNVRGMTYDGFFIYAGNGSDTISIIDPYYLDVFGYIIAPESVRYITFNPGADNGKGGFWIGSYYSDPTLIDMSGNFIGSIPYSTLGSKTNYGAVFDYYSSGGPFLWFWGYGDGSGNPQVIVQVDPSNGLPTGVQYDVQSDPVIGQDSCVAGGLFITNTFYTNKIVLGGVLQGSPDILFGYDITGSSVINAPAVTTKSASNVTESSATLNGIVNPKDFSTTVTFEYGTTTTYGNEITAAQSPVDGNSNVPVSADISSLQPSTTYHYRIKGISNGGISGGADVTFTTSLIIIIAMAPTVTTSSANNITENSAKLNGVVNPNNDSTIVVFEYGTTTTYGNQITASQSPINGSANMDVSASLTGLQPNTTYHYRVKGTNSVGVSTGDDITFTTSVSSSSPSVNTVDANNVTSNSVTLNGIVNPNNLVTTVSFQYGTTTAYSSQVAADQSPINGGTGNVNVSATITGLQPNTLYHFRVRATSGGNTVTGADATFTTAFDYPASINIIQTFTFNDFTRNSYKMIGLPGITNLKISELMTGIQNKEWNAFFDNGNLQDYLIEFNESSDFYFGPGKGFWILSKTSLSLNRSVNTVTLNNDNTYSITTHYGWNIISNPFDKDVIWSDVQNLNSLNSNDIINDWSGTSYNQAPIFKAYTGYYFYNRLATITALRIPYNFIGKIAKESVSKSTDDDADAIRLVLLADKQEVSNVVVGIAPSSKIGFDEQDYFAPPGDFADIRIHIENKNISYPCKQLSIDYRPEINDGQIYDLKIKNASKQSVYLISNGLENFPDYEVYLLDENLNRFHNLKYKNKIDISPAHTNHNYKLLIGDKDFINDLKKDYMPEGYILYQNYPNPFNPSTTIKYQIPDDNTFVELRVFNILGKELITLVNEKQEPGIYEVEFNSGNLSSGIYFYTLKAGSHSETKKMIVLK